MIAGFADASGAWLFVEQIAVGTLGGNEEELSIGEIRLLSVPSSVGRELARTQQQIGALSSDAERMQELSKDRRCQEVSIDRKGSRVGFAYSEAYRTLSPRATQDVENAISTALASAIAKWSAKSRNTPLPPVALRPRQPQPSTKANW